MKVCEWKLLMLVNVRNCMPGFVCQGLLYVTPMFVRLNRVRVAFGPLKSLVALVVVSFVCIFSV